MLGKKILIVENKAKDQQVIATYLEREGFVVDIVDNGDDVISSVLHKKPDLIILSIQLPNIEGIELCRQLRKFSATPIILISDKANDLDIILGLEVGGDDYITKPYSPEQLVARVKANLRRHMLSSSNLFASEKLVFTGLEIDISSHRVILNGEEISLSPKEFDLLVILARYPHRVFYIDDLYKLVWGVDSLGDTRTIIVHIATLRKKIEADSSNPKYIITVRGKGYKFNPTLQ